MSYVYFNRHQLFLRPEVMRALGLRRGQSVGEDALWRAMDLSAAAMRGSFEARGGPEGPFGRAFEETVGLLEDVVATHYKQRGAT